MNKTNVSQNIRNLRIQRKITQTEVARRLFVTPQTVSKWENGSALPDLENLCRLAELLQTTPDSLLGITKKNSEQRTFLGVDGGGTKTDFVIFREDGVVLDRYVAEGSNPNTKGMDHALDILTGGIRTAVDKYAICNAFCGVAGVVAANNRQIMLTALHKQFPQLPIRLESDIENVIASVRGVTKCTAAICGTGSVVYAWDGSSLQRVGGYGYLFDGAGSGYDIGRDVICACLEAEDGLRPHSKMTEMAFKKLGGGAWGRLNHLYKEGNDYIASFSPIAFEAYRQGDRQAEEILQKNFHRVARLIRHAQTVKDCGTTVLCAGGLTRDGDIIAKFLMQEGCTNPIYPSAPPVYGACVKAARMGNVRVPDEIFDKNFLGTIPE